MSKRSETMKLLPKYKAFTMKASIPREQYDAFKGSCAVVGETMTSVVSKLIGKVADGDRDLLDRVRA